MSEKKGSHKDMRVEEVRVNEAHVTNAKKGVVDTSIDVISLASHRRAIAYGRARGNA